MKESGGKAACMTCGNTAILLARRAALSSTARRAPWR